MFICEVDLGSQFIHYKLVVSHIHTYMVHRGLFCTSQSLEHTWPPPTCQPHSCPDQMTKKAPVKFYYIPWECHSFY